MFQTTNPPSKRQGLGYTPSYLFNRLLACILVSTFFIQSSYATIRGQCTDFVNSNSFYILSTANAHSYPVNSSIPSIWDVFVLNSWLFGHVWFVTWINGFGFYGKSMNYHNPFSISINFYPFSQSIKWYYHY